MTSEVEGPHLAGNVYAWHLPEQTALLVDAVAPAVRELRRGGDLRRFWFDRFDARGPHLFLLMTAAPGRLEAVRRRLGEAIQRHVAENPGGGEIGEEELRLRHRECLGKTLCAIDAEEGFAERGSLQWCEQPADGYPFRLLRETTSPEGAWQIYDELTGDALRSLEGGGSPMAAAVIWLSQLETALARTWSRPAEYWRHHAGSIIRRLPAEEMTATRLAQSLGAANLEVLSQAWGSEASPAAAPLERLLEILPQGDDRPSEESPYTGSALLREVVHVHLKQLALPIHRQRPLILYGWKRALDRAAGD